MTAAPEENAGGESPGSPGSGAEASAEAGAETSAEASAAAGAETGAETGVAGPRGGRRAKPRRAPGSAKPRGPPAAGRALQGAPDPAYFVRHGGRWRVRLAAFAPAGPAGREPALLRAALLAPESAAGLAELGADSGAGALPDDLLVAAAAGALVCLPFLEILDGGCFAQAPCLCCYGAHSLARAREAGAAFRIFRRYYDAGSYLSSRAFVRAVAGLARDLRAEEVAEVAAFLASLDSTADAVREINGRWAGRMCVAVPPCRPRALWVYSTPDGRRLLRHLARVLRRGGAPLKVAVASSDPAVFPRHRLRMYSAALTGGEENGPEGGGALLEAALAWSRAQSGDRP